jgi:hypothetical protein
MKACSRRIGRARPCINSDNTDYREHRMKSVYVRASMSAEDGGGGRARNSRSMQPLGYYCSKCQQFWTDDQVYRIVEELQEKRILQYLSSPGLKGGRDYAESI